MCKDDIIRERTVQERFQVSISNQLPFVTEAARIQLQVNGIYSCRPEHCTQQLITPQVTGSSLLLYIPDFSSKQHQNVYDYSAARTACKYNEPACMYIWSPKEQLKFSICHLIMSLESYLLQREYILLAQFCCNSRLEN